MNNRDKTIYDNRDFKELRNEWYDKLKESGFEDIEIRGRNSNFYNGYDVLIKRPDSEVRRKMEDWKFTPPSKLLQNWQIFVSDAILAPISHYNRLSNTLKLTQIDKEIADLHSQGREIRDISTTLRSKHPNPPNKKGRRGQAYSTFYVHSRIHTLSKLLIDYINENNLTEDYPEEDI